MVCHKDSNPERLLLCDNCDDAYHTYCLRPSIREVPHGNWFCPTCTKASGTSGKEAVKSPAVKTRKSAKKQRTISHSSSKADATSSTYEQKKIPQLFRRRKQHSSKSHSSQALGRHSKTCPKKHYDGIKSEVKHAQNSLDHISEGTGMRASKTTLLIEEDNILKLLKNKDKCIAELEGKIKEKDEYIDELKEMIRIMQAKKHNTKPKILQLITSIWDTVIGSNISVTKKRDRSPASSRRRSYLSVRKKARK